MLLFGNVTELENQVQGVETQALIAFIVKVFFKGSYSKVKAHLLIVL